MYCAETANLSAACEKLLAVFWAVTVRPFSASVRWRIVESVIAVASAPPATELAARSSWRIIAPSSSSSSSRISLAESVSEAHGASVVVIGLSGPNSTAGATGAGNRFLKPKAMSFSENWVDLKMKTAARTDRQRQGPESASSQSGVKSWLTTASSLGLPPYHHTETGANL